MQYYYLLPWPDCHMGDGTVVAVKPSGLQPSGIMSQLCQNSHTGAKEALTTINLFFLFTGPKHLLEHQCGSATTAASFNIGFRNSLSCGINKIQTALSKVDMLTKNSTHIMCMNVVYK